MRHRAERAEVDPRALESLVSGGELELLTVAGEELHPLNEAREVPVHEAGPVGAGGDRAGDRLPRDRPEDRQRKAALGELGVEIAQARSGAGRNRAGCLAVDTRPPVERYADLLRRGDGAPGVPATDDTQSLLGGGRVAYDSRYLLLTLRLVPDDRPRGDRARPVGKPPVAVVRWAECSPAGQRFGDASPAEHAGAGSGVRLWAVHSDGPPTLLAASWTSTLPLPVRYGPARATGLRARDA